MAGQTAGQAAEPVQASTGHWHGEQGAGSLASRLNWLRAGVLGANDGIVSTAGLVVGVAGATAERTPVLVAGVAGVVAGAMSMAVGEYVSVSTQRESERAVIERERRELEQMPEEELEELTQVYEAKGLSRPLAESVARELTERDPVAAHTEAQFGVDPDELTNPWHAAGASFVAFAVGALLPLLAIVVPPVSWRVPATVVAVVVALTITGWVSAGLGYAPRVASVARNVLGGLAAMVVTYGIGLLVGAQL